MNSRIDCLLAVAHKPAMAVLLVFVISTFGNRVASAGDPRVSVSLSACHVSTSTPIEVVESIEMPSGHGAKMISHRVTRIGIFHRKLDRFVLWNGRVLRGAQMIGLPRAEMAPHGIPMTETVEGRLAVHYEFQAPDPGIYLLNTEWSLITRDVDEKPKVRKGNPVLFFVVPAVDYEQQAAQRAGESEGLKLQSYLENQYDRRPSEVGFVMPDFEELALPH